MTRTSRHYREPVDSKAEQKKFALIFGTPNTNDEDDEYMQICFCGTHGTGKTTLMWEVVKWMQKDIGLPAVPCAESSRDPLLDVHDSNYEEFLIKKRASIFNHFGHFVSDRSLFDPLAYQKIVRGYIDKDLMDFAFSFSKDQILFYVPIKFELESDGVRPVGEEYQQKVQNVLIKVLERSNKKYYTVTRSDLIERLEFVKHVVMYREGWKDKLSL